MSKTKRQLRAEAVERLRGLGEHAVASSIQWALFGPGRDNMPPNELRDALIDLLTDDCDIECYCCSKLAELRAENSQLRARVDEQWDSNVTCPDGNGTASDDCGQNADMSAMSADCVRSEPGMSEVDSRDNGWYLRYDGYMTSKSNYLRISGFKAARALDNRQNLVFVKFMGGKEADCRVYAPKLDVCENLHDSSKETQKPRSREADSGNVSDSDGENLHVEHGTREKPWHERVDDYLATFDDSREKLEADVNKFVIYNLERGLLTYGAIIRLLDRQAAITRAEDSEWWGGVVAELQAKVNEYERDFVKPLKEAGITENAFGVSQVLANDVELIDEMKAKRDELEQKLELVLSHCTGGIASKAGIEASEMIAAIEENYERLHAEEAAELRKKVAELQSKLDEAKSENEASYARVNELYKEVDRLRGSVRELTSERTYWKAQVRTCLNSACMHNGHAVYSEGVMDYPREDGCCEPSLLVTAEVDHLRDFYADECRKSKRLEGEVKTQRNNFDQATGARDYWKEKLGIMLQRLRDLGCEVGGINDVPIDVKLPEVVE